MWQIGGFVELRTLGAGAQGRVVLARHEASGGLYAIKYVPGAGASQEARLLQLVTDPHVARLFDYVADTAYGAALVMEAVDGVPLDRVLARQGALTAEASLVVLKGSLLGLAAAHARGVVHRDYKPANVMVSADGDSKLIDFGVAVAAGVAGDSGTPAYMAPEQWMSGPASPSTDVYAATCVFYECLTGHPPYPGDVRGGHLNGDIPVADVPAGVRPLVAAGMAKTPAARPPGAAEFLTELENVAGEVYGPEWEHRGLVALTALFGSLAALSPLAALSGGAASTATSTGPATTTFARTVLRQSRTAKLLGGTTAKVTATAVAVAVVAAGATAVVAATGHHAGRRAAAAPPALLYTTASTVDLRTGDGRTRVLGPGPGNGTGSVPPLATSADGRYAGWLSGSTVELASVRGGPVQSWPCAACSQVAFLGDRLLASESGPTSARTPALHVYAPGVATASTLPVTGLRYQAEPMHFVLVTSLGAAAVVIGYGYAGGSDTGDSQQLYRVEASGQATLYGGEQQYGGTSPVAMGSLSHGAASADGRTVAFAVLLRAGGCGYDLTAKLLDTRTGRISTPTPPAGGGPEGYIPYGLWFDAAGTPQAAFVPNPSTCRTGGTALAGPVDPSHPIVAHAAAGSWVAGGTGTAQAAYASGGWSARLSTTSDSAPGTLVVGNGRTSATIPGVVAFRWVPPA